MSVELSRPWKAEAAFQGEAVIEVVADELERAAVAVRLGVAGIAELACRFSLSMVPGEFGRVMGEGRLRARMTRECVVSLDDFEEHITEAFRVVFVPEGTEAHDDDPEADDEVPYAGSTIDLGEATVEQVALMMAPYPRKPGVELAEEAGEQQSSPFAALSRLRTAH